MKWICILLFISLSAQAETIRVALSFDGKPPYSFGEQEHRGIYVEVFQEIFKLTPYQLEFVYLSSARVRSSFTDGKVDIECCPIGAWRANETAISIYSQPLFKTEDVYVFPQGKLRNIGPLADETIATINGFGYAFDTVFTRYDVESELKLLKLIEGNRLPVGIVDRTIVNYLSRSHQLTVVIGQVHEHSLRPLRIHKSKAHIVPIINQAINSLINNGKISAIVSKYTSTLKEEN
ncbi:MULTISPECIES: ABC transporter substrate-binding protein [unclassified Colwellia]|uniref:substrate-binding periplasmic protein n=1 Tax=unclassified Colwellia TaxID=196834 RepID=UPI0015F37A3C|nr:MULTISPECIES: transporter substrate-binding domain-containing protein [unclassified Colwellia]MBA6348912.1 transporter substrate-binding domain-containing protein [Colwellia sp. BRX8-9]MBA6352222.1 transporter substrate-binding domain-containing protein [Colwellia sp. BRX9-1]MBA6358050.1 transporter substrate-binding domain-containing protein [Colwellia sp. BRX8-3]MBA6362036.1 transporter substrate-binding domain-containing protein [Colwellia sp. BRX8-6]MBA6367825.1 transporter substrate-bi